MSAFQHSWTFCGGSLVRASHEVQVKARVPLKLHIAFSPFFLGISLLLFALFMSARMGIMQEVLYAKYGKHPREALFFTVSIRLSSVERILKK